MASWLYSSLCLWVGDTETSVPYQTATLLEDYEAADLDFTRTLNQFVKKQFHMVRLPHSCSRVRTPYRTPNRAPDRLDRAPETADNEHLTDPAREQQKAVGCVCIAAHEVLYMLLNNCMPAH